MLVKHVDRKLAMRVVQVVVPRTGFAETFGAMRDWLDRNDSPLVRFGTTSDGDNIVMKLHFDDDALGESFRVAFGGMDVS